MHPIRPCLALFATLSIASAAPDADAPAPPTPVVAVYDLEGLLSENGSADSSLLDFKPSRPLTLYDLSKSLLRARADDAVKAVVLDTDEAGFDLSQIQEIRSLLLDIRKAGKDVWLYTENLSNATALLGSAANHFTLMPEADCSFNGIYAESLYYKGLLDKVGIQADVIHIGDFKSFGENFYRTGPSEQSQQQTDALIDSIFAQLVDGVATGRNLPPEKVRALIDDGSLNPNGAVAAGLADHTLYRTDFVKMLHDTYKGASFERDYHLPDLDGPEINGLMDIFKLMFEKDTSYRSGKDFAAVVAFQGDITDGSIAPVRSEILRLVKDEHAKALVLRVDSPGGSALASEVLWEALDEWKQTKRPFVVSMGGVAASGGYYISCAADRIFAEPGTITGSIGVVGMKFVISGAMEKLGITAHATQRGKNAGISTMTHAYSPEEAGLVRKTMEEVYGTFKKRVTDGRGKALKGDLEPLAGGRVYSGLEALKIGLVDELGGLSEAIIYAKRQTGAAKLEVRFLPEPKSAIEGIFAKPQHDDDDIIRAGRAGNAAAISCQALLRDTLLEALPASSRAGVLRLSRRIESFRNSRVLLLGPDLDLHL